MKKYNPEIVFENDSFVAVNKPAGLLSIPDREQTQTSLKDILLEKYGAIFTVHRLDRDTSGIIIFAKTEAAHKYFSLLLDHMYSSFKSQVLTPALGMIRLISP